VRATVWLGANKKLAIGESAAWDVFGDIHDYEATLVQVLDDSGATVRIVGHSTLTGLGSEWSPPGMPPEGVPLGVSP
jgi:hypothetical protein